jgi:hypothetical protein
MAYSCAMHLLQAIFAIRTGYVWVFLHTIFTHIINKPFLQIFVIYLSSVCFLQRFVKTVSHEIITTAKWKRNTLSQKF